MRKQSKKPSQPSKKSTKKDSKVVEKPKPLVKNKVKLSKKVSRQLEIIDDSHPDETTSEIPPIESDVERYNRNRGILYGIRGSGDCDY
jgi:hypothetical protein